MSYVIFPTDFSENAEKAFDFALHIAKFYKEKLLVVNAFDLPYSQNVMSTSLIDIMRATSKEGVKKYVKKAEAFGLECEGLSLMGNPIRVVKNLTDKLEGSAVVMGTKGASGLEEVLIGSNANSILHSVDVPVLTIPPTAKFSEIKRMVYCSDFQSTKNKRALCRLARFAKVFDAEIMVLHVTSKKDLDIEKYKKKFASCLSGQNYSIHIVEGKDVENTINEFVVTHQADLVSLLVRRYGLIQRWFQSKGFASKMAFHASVPFLAVHETKEIDS